MPGNHKTLGQKTLNFLCAYPFLWTLGILFGGLLKSHLVIVFVMLTWVIYVYAGLLSILGLIIYLPIKKKITIKQTVTYILIFTIGTLAAYFVTEYDIFSSGVKYMD